MDFHKRATCFGISFQHGFNNVIFLIFLKRVKNSLKVIDLYLNGGFALIL